MEKYSLTHLQRHSVMHIPQYSMSSLTWSSLAQETSSREQGMSAICWRLRQLRDPPESSRRGSMGCDDTGKRIGTQFMTSFMKWQSALF